MLLNLSMQQRRWLMVILTLTALLIVMFVGLQTMRSMSAMDNKTRIIQLTSSAYNTITAMEKKAAQGELTVEQAKAAAAAAIHNNSYHDSEYVWVTDENFIFVAAANEANLLGTSYNNFPDANGNGMGRVVSQALQGKGNKLIEFYWDSERDGTIVKLLSVAQRTPNWGWVVGNGVSFAEADARFWEQAKWQMLICLLLTAGVSVVIITMLRSISQDLGGEPNSVREQVLIMAQGDLTQPMQVQQNDTRSLLYATETMRKNLNAMVAKIRQFANEVQQAALEMSSVSQQTLQGVEQQSLELHNSATAMNEMTSTLAEVARNTQNTADASESANDQTLAGSQLVQSTIKTMEQLNQDVASSTQAVERVQQDSIEIAGILQVIEGIAEQTNLLALNAAIEAARAGETGRGFAVVADEVRSLASRTMDSTTQIKEMIERLQSGVGQAVSAMTHSNDRASQSAKQVQEMGTALQRISQAVQGINETTQHIAVATEEQSSVAQSINESLHQVQDVAMQTASSVQNSASASQRLTDLSEELGRLINQFKTQ